MSDEGPPEGVWLELEEALDLLAALEDARETFQDAGQLAGVMQVETPLQVLVRKLRLDEGGSDDA